MHNAIKYTILHVMVQKASYIPLGHRQRYPPSVFMQAPPWHNVGLRLHSLTSIQECPSFESIIPFEHPPQSEVRLHLRIIQDELSLKTNIILTESSFIYKDSKFCKKPGNYN